MDSPPAPRTHLFPPKQKGGWFRIKNIYVWWCNCKTSVQMEIFELLDCKLCSLWKWRWGDGCDDVDEDDGGDTAGDRGWRDLENISWYGDRHMIIVTWASLYDDHILATHCQSDRLSENVWFVWSKSSYIRCVISTLWQTGNRRTESGK